MAWYLTESDIGKLLTMADALEVLEEMFVARSRGEIVNHPRSRIPIPNGSYAAMSAGWVRRGVVGHKTYTAAASKEFHITLYAADGSGLLALIAGRTISALRTGAVTGLAARHLLARPGSPIAVIGAGYQASAQIEGLLAAMPDVEIRVFSRSAERRESLAAQMAQSTSGRVRAADSIEAALDGATVAVTITNSRDPVLRPEHVTPGLTIVAAGNNQWYKSEIDPMVVARADIVVVDDLDNARIESGELMRAADAGLFNWDSAVPFHDIVGGSRRGRLSANQVILVELQGIAIEDVAVGHLAYRRALERGIGHELPS